MLEGDVRKLPQFACHSFFRMHVLKVGIDDLVSLDLANFVAVHTSNRC